MAIWSINLSLALRVELLKARARRDRWIEEVDLLSTELARTTAFFDGKVNWWMSLVDKRLNVSPELSEGLCAARPISSADMRTESDPTTLLHVVWALSQSYLLYVGQAADYSILIDSTVVFKV